MITLVAVLCHAVAGIPLCVDEVVPTEMMVAGKADDPVPMPFTWEMCRSDGIKLAVDWAASQQQYHDWQVIEVKCVPGKYESSKRA